MSAALAMAMSQAFGLGLLLLALVTYMQEDWRLFRAALALGVNFALVWVFTIWSGWFDAWLFFLPLDAMTAWAILRPPHGMTQAMIGALLLSQCAIHVGYAVLDNRMVAGDYLDLLSAVGWVQLATLAGGAGYERGKQIVVRWVALGNRSMASAPYSAIMGEPK